MDQLLYKLETAFRTLVPGWLFAPRYCLVFEFPCENQAASSPRLLEFTFRWSSEKDTVALVQKSALSNRRLELGDRAAIILRNGKIVGTLWVALGVYYDLDTGLSIDLEPRQAWLYGAWIHRDLRGQGLYSQLFGFVIQSLKESCDSMLLAVDWSNRHSQKVHAALSGNRIGSIFGIRILGRRIYRFRK